MTTATFTPPVVPTPRKSRRRWIALAAAGALLIALPMAYYFVADWHRDRQMDAITQEIDAEDPDWRWPDLVAQIKTPPDERNSAVQVLKVQAILKKTPLKAGPKWDNAPNDPLRYRNARLANELVEPLRGAFKALSKELPGEARKLKDMPAGRFAVEAADNPFMIKLEHIQHTREVMNLLQMDSVLRAHDGDLEGAAESCQAIVNVSSALREQPFLIPLLVRLAGQNIAVGAIERTLGQGNVSEANLRKLQEMLAAEAADDGLNQALRGERAGAHQMYLRLRNREMTFSELFEMMSNKGASREAHLFDLFPGIVLNGYPDYLRLMNEQVRISKLQGVERSDAFEQWETKVRERRSLIIMMLMPASMKVSQSTQRTQANLRCTIAALAAERYRISHDNVWPRGLDDLVKAGLLKEVPTDPCDGKPLRWKRTPTGVIVYSVGLDRTDDGGKLDRNNPFTAGTDIGFELWDTVQRGVPPPAVEEVPK